MKSILLIDDDRDDTELFKEAVENIDPTISFYSFDDGNEAIEALVTEGISLPDMVFLDINMPSVSGWDCLRRLKKTDALRGIPVIMYTTSSLTREKEIAYDLGASGFITKPEDYKALKEMVNVILSAPSEKLPQALKTIEDGQKG
jgi:CheY-like chemotaxis protein